MRVLIACEESQTVCKAFRARGHEAYSCDIQEPSGGHPEWHIHGDVLPILRGGQTVVTMDGKSHEIPGKWDLIIAHPPCTYLTPAGACNIPRHPDRIEKGWEAREFLLGFLRADCPRIAVENPPPMKRFNLPSYTQIISPYMFGDPVDKKTALWLKGLPPLKPTKIVNIPTEKYIYYRKKDHKKMTLSLWYQNANDGKNWSRNRSRTFPGIAEAMAEQRG